jgi:hypothetical protein
VPPNNVKPLLPEEIPENIRGSFDFDSQVIGQLTVFDMKPVMIINQVCTRCSTMRQIKVADIRKRIKRGTFSGLCRSCFPPQKIPCPKGPESKLWKGGRRKTRWGYITLRDPSHPYTNDGYVFEHRVVMEKHLGRYLFPFETVHHKNGIKDDNRIENLELWTGSHNSGVRYIDLSNTQLKEMISFLNALLLEREKDARLF